MPAILAECRDTLSQPKLRHKFPHLTDERVDAFLQRIGQIAQLVPAVRPVWSMPRDPDDAMYVDLAAATQADFIVSRDHDLLDLMKDEEFRKAYPWLTIVDPAAFLFHVRAEVAKKLGDD